jgi:hypothetical protein
MFSKQEIRITEKSHLCSTLNRIRRKTLLAERFFDVIILENYRMWTLN